MVPVIGEGGWRGEIHPGPETVAPGGEPRVIIRPAGGEPLLVPARLLLRQSDGSYYVPVSRADLERIGERDSRLAAAAAVTQTATTVAAAPVVQQPVVQQPVAAAQNRTVAPATMAAINESEENIVVPVVEETMTVGKRMVETGRVRVTKTVTEMPHVIDQPLLREEVTVERVPVNQVLSRPAEIRQEGDTTIVPLMEEVVVVEKRLVLKEELHIRRQTTTVREPQTVTLRREEAHVERISADVDNDAAAEQDVLHAPIAS